MIPSWTKSEVLEVTTGRTDGPDFDVTALSVVLMTEEAARVASAGWTAVNSYQPRTSSVICDFYRKTFITSSPHLLPRPLLSLQISYEQICLINVLLKSGVFDQGVVAVHTWWRVEMR